MKKSKIAILLVSIFAFVAYSNVYAEDKIESYLTCQDKVYYQVTWDKTKSTGVNKNDINLESIKRGYSKDVTGMDDLEKAKYKINSQIYASECYVNKDGSIKTCPSGSDLDSYKSYISSIYKSDGNTFEYIKYEFDVNSGTYTIKIKAEKNLNLRYVPDSSQENVNRTRYDGSNYSMAAKDENYYVIKNVAPSYVTTGQINPHKILLEFYINNNKSECNGSYVASIQLTVPTTENVKVPNPAKNSANCNAVNNYISQLKKNGYITDSTVEKGIKNFVNLCYDNEVKLDDYYDIYTKIDNQFNNLKTSLGIFDFSSSNSEAFCEKEISKKKIVASYSGTYWGATCTETNISKGDSAKLVYAGAGFGYHAVFTTVKECSITFKQQVHMKPVCQYSCDWNCSWVGVTGIVHDASADKSLGPNDDFDDCVKECDGGKYSQTCINTCYTRVYGERKLPNSDDKLSLNYETKDETRKINSITVFDSLNGLSYSHSFPGVGGKSVNVYTGVVSTPCGNETISISDYCANGHGSCTLTISSGPSGCSDSPGQDYVNDLSQSTTELSYIEEFVNAKIGNGEFTTTITDSYLKNDKKEKYTYVINPKGEIIVDTDNDKDEDCVGGKSKVALGDSGGEDVTYCTKAIRTKIIGADLAPAYLNKMDGTAVYYNDGNGKYMFFDTTNSNNKLENYHRISGNVNKGFEEKDFYTSGNNYFTNVLSNNHNVKISNNKASLVSPNGAEKNIKIQAAFGTNNSYKIDIPCYYGVYNQTYCKGESCPNGNGIQFIFRPIELKDMFPNGRNPRWNWTDGAGSGEKVDDYLNYKVEPSALIADIEAKGNSIYTNPAEIDYEFELTPAQLRNIRNDNKKMKDAGKTYVDYDMNCTNYKNREYCYSEEFLNNDSFVKFNISNTERINKAICNNTYGNQCTNE